MEKCDVIKILRIKSFISVPESKIPIWFSSVRTWLVNLKCHKVIFTSFSCWKQILKLQTEMF